MKCSGVSVCRSLRTGYWQGRKKIRRAGKRRTSEAVGGKKFGERDTEEWAKRCLSVYGKLTTHSDKLFST